MKTLSFYSEEHPSYPIHITVNVILTTFLGFVSAVATMIGDTSIQGELALSETESVWITILYLLGINTMVPTSNWFSNQFGALRTYTAGIVLFTLASLMAAFSTNFMMIASARFIEGVGGGFIFPVGLALIASSMPKEKIALAINLYIAIAIGGGLGLGLIVSGYFSQFYSWREIFLLIVFLGSLASISCFLMRRNHPITNKTPFDFAGFTSYAIFISSFLIALTLGPIRSTPQGWTTSYILILFFIAATSFILWIYFELNSPSPLFPFKLFKDPIFSVCLAAMFLLGMATFASVSISVHYMLNGIFYEKWTTAQIASIYGFTLCIFSVIANYLCKIVPVPLLTFTGLSFLVFSYFYNNELSILTGSTQVIAILLIRGVGIGLALGPTTLMALYGVPQEMKGAGATMLTFVRQVGGTYGGTLISIISIKRTIFHAARFGEQTNTQLPAYQYTFKNLFNRFPDPAKAGAAIIKNIETQAQIQGLNDALFIFGYVTSVVAIILAILISYRIWKK